MSLRLCAHCGHAASEREIVDEVTGRERYVVTCSNCEITTGPHLVAAGARMVWNRRPESTAAERAQAILQRYGGDICGALQALERYETVARKPGETP